jgi:hypothetical protein
LEEQFAQPTFELPQASFNPEPAAATTEEKEELFEGLTFELPLANEPAMASEPDIASHEAASFASYPLSHEEASAAFVNPPTAELPPSPAPTITPEPSMALLLPPPETEDSGEYEDSASHKPNGHDDDRYAPVPQPVTVGTYVDDAVTLRRSRGVEFLSWLYNHLPARPDHVPADAIEPSWAERRTARGLAAALAVVAVLSLLPVVLLRHVDLRSAPPWALWTVLFAAVQLVFAGWLANAPDWATVRVQMIVSAGLTTLYAMAMTLLLLTPSSRTLILGLDEVRPLGAAWCGLMFFLLGAATWCCGRTSTRWREQIEVERLNMY